MTEAKKLTKAQREFFERVTRALLMGIIFVALDGDIDEETSKYVESVDVAGLTEAVGAAYLAEASFADVKRVDKFIRSDEFQAVQRAGGQVGEACKDALVTVVKDILQAKSATKH